MTERDRHETAPGRRLGALVFWLLVCLGVGALGGLVTSASVETWYQELAKPLFTPPDWVFAPVWTALYALMAVAVWRARECGAGRLALALFGLQLAANLGWSALFFGLRRPDLALAEIAVLFALIVATIGAFRVRSRLAAALMVPYALWVAYAAALNGAIWWLNL